MTTHHIESKAQHTAHRFLRDSLHPPRAAQFMAAHPGCLDPVRLQQFIDDVWTDLVTRLASPVRVIELDDEGYEGDYQIQERQVWFIDTLCYRLHATTGVFSINALQRDGTMQEVDDRIAVDPPLISNGGWLVHYLYRWNRAMHAVLIHQSRPGGRWNHTVRRLFWQAVRRSTWWKRIRYAMRNALALDAKALAWCRQGRPRHINQSVDNRQYNRAIDLRANYAQIEHDNPRLIWLYTFMLDEKVELPPGEAISAMRQWLTERKVSPAGWRLIANGREKDFRHIRDWISPEGAYTSRRIELTFWLRFFASLRRKTPLAQAVRNLFLHDYFKPARHGHVFFRGVAIDVPVLKAILAEAERRLAQGSFRAFVQRELTDIVVWLETAEPRLDTNQQKAGWAYLAARAAQWRAETAEASQLEPMRWRSLLGETRIGPWTVVPLTDAWGLRQEALRQHHCVDSYRPACMDGDKRIFSVRNAKGRPAATLSISLEDGTWKAQSLRGACNKAVGPGMDGLADEAARRYTELWCLEAHPDPAALPSPPPAPAPAEDADAFNYVQEMLAQLG